MAQRPKMTKSKALVELRTPITSITAIEWIKYLGKWDLMRWAKMSELLSFAELERRRLYGDQWQQFRRGYDVKELRR